MNPRTWRQYVWTFFGLLSIVDAAVGAPFSLGGLGIVPRVVPPNIQVTVTVTMQISDTTFIPGSAVLYRADMSGKPIAKLATFTDDGTGGDLVAGDGILAARFGVKESQPTQFPLVATAAFKGTLLRTFSNLSLMEVAAGVDMSMAKGVVQGNQVVFSDSSANVVRTIPFVSLRDSLSDSTITRLTEEVILSGDQGHAGVLTWQMTAPSQSDEVHEFSTIYATFRNYTGQDGLTWQLVAPSGKQFFLPNDRNLYSAKGDRVALIAVDDQDSQADLAVYSNTGAKLYQSLETFAAVRDAAMSRDGRYLGTIVVRATGPSGTYVFQVVLVDSGQVWERTFDPDTVDSYYFVESSDGFTLMLNNLPTVSLP